MVCSSKSLIACATILAPLTIIFIVIGFATDHWSETDVIRSKLPTIEATLSNKNQEIARIYHTRHRGILRECYPKVEATFLDAAANVVSGNCFYIDFEDPEVDAMSSRYQQRMHLLRSTLALYVLGMVLIIVVFFLGVALCFTKSYHVSHAASLTSIIGGLLVISSLVMFHATEYIEANKDGDSGELLFQNNWSKNLVIATSSKLGYSYALAWVGLILAMTQGIIFLLVARALKDHMMDNYSDTDSTISSSERDDIAKRSRGSGSNRHKGKHGMEKFDFYDNFGGFPVYGQHSGIFQTVAGYPSITYGNSIYSNPEMGI